MLVTTTIILTVWLALVYFYHPTPPIELSNINVFVWDYLLHDPIFSLPNTTLLDIRSRRHLLDVKKVISNTQQLLIILSLLLPLLLFWRRKQIKVIGCYVAYLGFTFLCVLSGISLFAFRFFFNALHQLFFPAQTWIFAPDSVLIQLFPLTYFQYFTGIGMGISLLLFSVLFIFSCCGKYTTIKKPEMRSG